MGKYVIRRILMIIPVLLGAIIVIFTINYFSVTNPAEVKLGLKATDEELLAEMEHEMGLDQPYIVQLGNYLWDLLHGDLGDSYTYSKTVSELLASRIPNTLRISIGALIMSIGLGVPLGLWAALKQNTAADYIISSLAIIFSAIPGFIVAVILMQVFSVQLGWFPVSGTDAGAISYVLPIIASGLGTMTPIVRMTRSSVLDVIRQDYVRTARAKGIAEGKVTTRHVLKNALIPILTMIGSGIGNCLAGSILVEMIFQIPGMGMLINSSINSKDYITVQGCVVVCALMVAVANLITDLAYAFVDPRIKAQYTSGSKKKKKAATAAQEG